MKKSKPTWAIWNYWTVFWSVKEVGSKCLKLKVSEVKFQEVNQSPIWLLSGVMKWTMWKNYCPAANLRCVSDVLSNASMMAFDFFLFDAARAQHQWRRSSVGNLSCIFELFKPQTDLKCAQIQLPWSQTWAMLTLTILKLLSAFLISVKEVAWSCQVSF